MKFLLSDKVYDVLKWLVLIVLPAANVLYRALDATFGWAQAETVCTVITAVQVFVGTLIGVSTSAYNAEKQGEAVDDGSQS